MTKAKSGRPSKYSEEDILRIAKVSYQLGATDIQVAEQLGITERTINNWKKKHPTFFQSLKSAKDLADDQVEASLFKRACGYRSTIMKAFKGEQVETEVEYPPDPTSCIFWLKNRRPEQWREKQEHVHSGGDDPVTYVIRPDSVKQADWEEYWTNQISSN